MKCEDKIKYPTEEHAARKIKLYQKRGMVNLRQYQCDTCGSWHLTHKPIHHRRLYSFD